MNAELLKILCCPETHQPLAEAPAEKVSQLNSRIEGGELKNKAGHAVREKIDGCLVRQDGKIGYAVRQGIPIMLIDEGLLL